MCRQIYAETALTSYRENVFLFEGHGRAIASSLSAVQRKAIRTFEPSPPFLLKITRVEDRHFRIRKSGILGMMPNVQALLVSQVAMSHIKECLFLGKGERQAHRLWTEQQWRDLLAERLKCFTDAGIELVYED